MLSTQHAVTSGGLIPHPSKSSFNFGEMFENAIDPFGIFHKTKDSIQHTVDTGDRVYNRGLDSGEQVFNNASDAAENASEGLDNLVNIFTKFGPILIVGVIVISVIK